MKGIFPAIKEFLFGSTDRPSDFDPDGVFIPGSLRAWAGRTSYGIQKSLVDRTSQIEKLNVIFSSPAVLKVFKLQCDLFSLGKVYLYNENEEDISKGQPIIELLNNPNPWQDGSQLLWDIMFWNMIGTANIYMYSAIVSDKNKIYVLDNTKLDFPDEFVRSSDHLVFSEKAQRDINKTKLKYKYEDGTSIEFEYGQLIQLFDLTNGIGSRYSSPSCIDALHKIIANSEHTLDATNINVRYTGKFLVAGKQDPDNTQELPLTETEQEDIETKMNGKKKVHALKSMIEIKRFVENLSNLKLPEMYMEQFFLIGSMYNIPRDVLEASLKGSTYENQEKSTGRHISYCLQPKGDTAMNRFSRYLNVTEGKLLVSWDHLPFMQVFEKDRAATNSVKISTLTSMLKLGIDISECNKFLDTNFTNAEFKEPKPKPGTAAA